LSASVEVESGRRLDRPKLDEALAAARVRQVPLVDIESASWGHRQSNARAAPDRLAPSRNATRPGARQRTLPDAENCGGEVSFRTSLPSHHSITSSARASSVGGNSRPRVLAVWALMTSSNFDVCTTGRSAGLAPLRMRPA